MEEKHLLVNDSTNTNYEHGAAVEEEKVLLDYSNNNISIKYKMIFLPLSGLRTELIGPSQPRGMDSLCRNEKDPPSLLSPVKERLQRHRNGLWAVSREEGFCIKARCWHNNRAKLP